MKALRADTFFLIVFFTSSIQNELRPDTENVCLQSETYEETIVEKVRKPVRETKRRWCWKAFKRFSCKKEIVYWEMVDQPRVVNISRLVPKCCSGFEKPTATATKCVPVCPKGCVHGSCTAPGKCTCTSVFRGLACEERSQVTPEKTTEIKSTTETTAPKTSSSHKIKMLMSEIEKITNTHSIPQTTIRITTSTAKATLRMTGEVSDETSTTEPDDTKMKFSKNEISTEKSSNSKMSTAAEELLNLIASVTASTKETEMEIKCSNSMEERIGLRNATSIVWNSTEKSNTEGNDVPTISESEDTSEHTGTVQNHFPTVLYILVTVSGSVLVVIWWITARHRKESRTEIRDSETQKKCSALYSKEQNEFIGKNLARVKLFSDRSKSPISMRDSEPNNAETILLGPLPFYDQSPAVHSDKRKVLFA